MAAVSEDMCLDQAVLQAVCIATERAQGSTRLFIFTEKPDSTPAACVARVGEREGEGEGGREKIDSRTKPVAVE